VGRRTWTVREARLPFRVAESYRDEDLFISCCARVRRCTLNVVARGPLFGFKT
jgi:hypothetical protein